MSSKAKQISNVLITIDETGSYKSDRELRNYCIVESVTRDRDSFAKVIENLKNPGEVGFSNYPTLRRPVIEQLAPFIDDVHYVYTYRPPGYEFIPKGRKLHMTLLKELKSFAGLPLETPSLIMVDNNRSLISDSEVCGILYPNDEWVKDTYCVVLPSMYFHELQAHDFITGAIGHELNRFDSKYTKILVESGVRIKGKRIPLPLRSEMDVRA